MDLGHLVDHQRLSDLVDLHHLLDQLLRKQDPLDLLDLQHLVHPVDQLLKKQHQYYLLHLVYLLDLVDLENQYH